ncbi:hypothetical protein GQ44DRAFT_826080 [Phaeosphaeriaceae sp. PMI808]|nr:hypothetical protein GQ44DRAFT_826080 [Phaeosphaeriaceae sp. PMI808]
MVPRKRKATELASTQEPNKRVTRSSTRPVAQAPSESSNVKPKISKSTASATPVQRSNITNDAVPPKARVTAQTKKGNAKHAKDEAANLTSTPSSPKELSITSKEVKNPIQLHLYTPLDTPSSLGNSVTPRKTPPSTATLIFTHGAGGTLSAPAVVDFCTGFSTMHPILAFQGSANLASRVKAFHACIKHVEESNETQGGAGPERLLLLLGGRSMGARAVVMAATQILKQKKYMPAKIFLILVSYPLQGPKGDVRSQILLDLPGSVSVLFIIGDRDAMCPLKLLDNVRGKMKAASHWAIVKGADHGMHVKPANLDTDRLLGEQTGREAAKWVARDGKGENVEP